MSAEPLRLVVVTASVREGRFGPVVTRWIADEARTHGEFALDELDLREAALPPVITDTPPAEVEALRPRLREADAFLIVMPEYNRGYPASLKTFIDWYLTEWRAKPFGFVSYGGRSGALRSVDHLGSVLCDLHAVPLRDVVSFHDAWDGFDEQGLPRDGEGADAAAKTLLDRLLWWGYSLREARAARPFDH